MSENDDGTGEPDNMTATVSDDAEMWPKSVQATQLAASQVRDDSKAVGSVPTFDHNPLITIRKTAKSLLIGC